MQFIKLFPFFHFLTGADDVLKFQGNESAIDHFRLILRSGDSLLVGGRWVIQIDFPSFLFLAEATCVLFHHRHPERVCEIPSNIHDFPQTNSLHFIHIALTANYRYTQINDCGSSGCSFGSDVCGSKEIQFFFAFCELAKSMRNVRCWWTLPAAPSHQLGCRPEIWIRYVTLYTPTPTKKPFFVNDFHRMRMRSLKQSKKEQNFHLNFSPNIRKRFHFFFPVFLFEGTKQHTKKARDIQITFVQEWHPRKG